MTFDLFRLHVLFSHGNKIVKMHSKTPRNNVNQNVNKAITKWSLIFTTISPIAGAWRIDQNDVVLKRVMTSYVKDMQFSSHNRFKTNCETNRLK